MAKIMSRYKVDIGIRTILHTQSMPTHWLAGWYNMCPVSSYMHRHNMHVPFTELVWKKAAPPYELKQSEEVIVENKEKYSIPNKASDAPERNSSGTYSCCQRFYSSIIFFYNILTYPRTKVWQHENHQMACGRE